MKIKPLSDKQIVSARNWGRKNLGRDPFLTHQSKEWAFVASVEQLRQEWFQVQLPLKFKSMFTISKPVHTVNKTRKENKK